MQSTKIGRLDLVWGRLFAHPRSRMIFQKCTTALTWLLLWSHLPSAWGAPGPARRAPPGMRWPSQGTRATICLLIERYRDALGTQPGGGRGTWSWSFEPALSSAALHCLGWLPVASLCIWKVPKVPSMSPEAQDVFISLMPLALPLSHLDYLLFPWTLQVYFWFKILTCNALPSPLGPANASGSERKCHCLRRAFITPPVFCLTELILSCCSMCDDRGLQSYVWLHIHILH